MLIKFIFILFYLNLSFIFQSSFDHSHIKMTKLKLIFQIFLYLFIINQKINSQIMNCKYLNIITREYLCSLDMLIGKTSMNSTKVTGKHLDDKSDDDVMKVFLESRTYSYSFPLILCEKFKFLKSVDTSNSLIQFIQENSLKSCTNLEQLMLFNEDDVELPENLFFYNTKLTSLKLALNSVQTLSKNLLKNQVQSLNILDLQIKTGNFLFPWDFFNDLENLFTLKLSIIGLKILDPGWFKKLINLEELHIFQSEILNLPKNIFSSMINLRKISLISNNLTVLQSESFSGLNNLSVLDLMNNKIHSIDPKIYKLVNLRVISLSLNFCGTDSVFDLTPERNLLRNYTDACTRNYLLRS